MSEVKLQSIENDRKITREDDGEFLYEFQKALLLALVESGRLTEQQFRYANDQLRRQLFASEKEMPHIRQTTHNVRDCRRR